MRDASSDLRPILIAGPTASGKSALALAIAEHVGGVIVNADSMQVYRELRILSARPTPDEEARVPHTLYGFVSAAEAYSAGRFARDAAAAIGLARSEGRRPVIVGGTGLYFKALLEGLSPIPRIGDAVRDHWRAEADRIGAAELHCELARRDAVMAARLAPADTQRIVRALEVIEATGRSLAEWQKVRDPPILDEADTRPAASDARPLRASGPGRRALRPHDGGRGAGRGAGHCRHGARSRLCRRCGPSASGRCCRRSRGSAASTPPWSWQSSRRGNTSKGRKLGSRVI